MLSDLSLGMAFISRCCQLSIGSRRALLGRMMSRAKLLIEMHNRLSLLDERKPTSRRRALAGACIQKH